MVKALHGWLITYNSYTGKWQAVERDNYAKLFNEQDDDVIESKSIDSLISVIMRFKTAKGIRENVK